jgi:RND family efflux transporter MFP subunit
MYNLVRTFIICILITLSLTTQVTKAVDVYVVTANHEAHNQLIELSGTVVAKYDAQLAPLESGVVKEIYVEAGDVVSRGQKLIELDDVLARLRLSQAEAGLLAAKVNQKEAKRQLDEVLSLAASKAVAGTLIAERRAKLASAEAELANATASVEVHKEILNRHVLVAPFAGVVSNRNVDVGEWISQQSMILQLVSNNSLRLVMYLPQEHFADLAANPEVMVTVIPDVSKNKRYQLQLSNFVSTLDPTSRTVQMRVDLPEDSSLVPGMSALARFSLSRANDTLSWIPRSALKRHPDGGYSAFSVNAGIIKRHKVQLIDNDSDRVAVTGLPDGAQVVISGTELLKDNQAVTIVSQGN